MLARIGLERRHLLREGTLQETDELEDEIELHPAVPDSPVEEPLPVHEGEAGHQHEASDRSPHHLLRQQGIRQRVGDGAHAQDVDAGQEHQDQRNPIIDFLFPGQEMQEKEEKAPRSKENEQEMEERGLVGGGAAHDQGMVLLDASVGERIEQADGMGPAVPDDRLERVVQALFHPARSNGSAELVARFDGQQAVVMARLAPEDHPAGGVGFHVSDGNAVAVRRIILADADHNPFHGLEIVLFDSPVHPLENPALEAGHRGIDGILLLDEHGNGIQRIAPAGERGRQGRQVQGLEIGILTQVQAGGVAAKEQARPAEGVRHRHGDAERILVQGAEVREAALAQVRHQPAGHAVRVGRILDIALFLQIGREFLRG